MMVGTLLGVVITLVIITQLPIVQAALTSSILLASLIVFCAYLTNRLLWWMAVGAIAGIIIGLGGIMAGHLAEDKEPLESNLRLTFVVFQSIAGFIAGVILGRQAPKNHFSSLTDFLASLAGLTVGLYALVVTSRFIAAGLIPAQELAERLNAATTVLITLLAIPGAVGYILTNWRRDPERRKIP